MSKNLVALLIAGALILLSALEISYLSTKSTGLSKQVALPLDESMTKRARPRTAVPFQGLPIEVAPGLVPARVAQPQPPISQQ